MKVVRLFIDYSGLKACYHRPRSTVSSRPRRAVCFPRSAWRPRATPKPRPGPSQQVPGLPRLPRPRPRLFRRSARSGRQRPATQWRQSGPVAMSRGPAPRIWTSPSTTGRGALARSATSARQKTRPRSRSQCRLREALDSGEGWRHVVCFGLAELNEHIGQLLEELNARPMRVDT